MSWWAKSPWVHLAATVWALIILLLSVTPGNEMPQVQLWQADKWGHIIVYLVLAYLTYFSFKTLGVRKIFLVTLLIVVGYGYLIEIVQGRYCQGRMYDDMDVIANSAGAALGSGLAILRNRTKR